MILYIIYITSCLSILIPSTSSLIPSEILTNRPTGYPSETARQLLEAFLRYT
jgi:hypothetical protein